MVQSCALSRAESFDPIASSSCACLPTDRRFNSAGLIVVGPQGLVKRRVSRAKGEPDFQVLPDAVLKHALVRAARPMPRRCAVLGPALDRQPCQFGHALRR